MKKQRQKAIAKLKQLPDDAITRIEGLLAWLEAARPRRFEAFAAHGSLRLEKVKSPKRSRLFYCVPDLFDRRQVNYVGAPRRRLTDVKG